MPQGIMILGPIGSGKTTLGKLVAKELGLVFIDVDDYIWRTDTRIPYTVMYPERDQIKRLTRAVKEAKQFVMAGSLDSFHDKFDPMFRLAVYLTASERVRVERVHRREVNRFGNRVLLGGDMYESHQAFLVDVGRYDAGSRTCTSKQQEAWLSQLRCPILRLNGEEMAENNARDVANAYRKLK